MKAIIIGSLIAALFCTGCSAPTANDAQIENRVYTGKIIVLIVDYFQQQTSEMFYKLKMDEDGKIVPLHFLNLKDIPHLESGMRVEILGKLQNGKINVVNLKILDP